MSSICCAAINCRNCKAKSSKSFFRFPKEKLRCKRWVINTKRKDFDTIFTKNYLFLNTKRLCSDHFEESQFMNTMRKRLILNAVPTLFDIPNPPKRLGCNRRPISKTDFNDIPVGKEQLNGSQPEAPFYYSELDYLFANENVSQKPSCSGSNKEESSYSYSEEPSCSSSYPETDSAWCNDDNSCSYSNDKKRSGTCVGCQDTIANSIGTQDPNGNSFGNQTASNSCATDILVKTTSSENNLMTDSCSSNCKGIKPLKEPSFSSEDQESSTYIPINSKTEKIYNFCGGGVCAMVYCDNRTIQKDHKTFHVFPKSKELCREWVHLCRKADLDEVFRAKGPLHLNQNYRICSDHFPATAYNNPNNRSQGLKKFTIPSVNLPPSGSIQKDEVPKPRWGSPKKRSNSDSYEENIFYEEAMIRPLPSGHIYTYFEFTTLWSSHDIEQAIQNYEDFEFAHYNLFPRPLGEIVEKYSVRELHLSLTQGLWRYQKWGYPVQEGPPGAQLWVWFNPHTPNIDQTWKDLVNALSGLFCASLNFIDFTNTVSPELSYRPLGVAEKWFSNNSSYMRYAALPRENVCTENLTPWKKLLPCDTKAGLATLLHASPLYSAHYHSLALNLRPVCKEEVCSKPMLELAQSLSVVERLLHTMEGKQDWSLKSLFSTPLISVCPLAKKSKLYVDITGNEDMSVFSLSPPPHSIEASGINNSKRVYAIYDNLQMVKEMNFNLKATYSAKHIFGNIPALPLHISRFITGYGQEGGSITVKLTNSEEVPLTVVYLEVLPWYLRLFFHPSHSNLHSMYVSKLVTARDRERGWLYEAVIEVPPKASIELKLEFSRALLKWLEYPPDANHGFYLPSAIFSSILPTAKNVSVNRIEATGLLNRLLLSDSPSFVRIASETLLVSLPTPDFSMPYNVICLACTVVALAFGPIHNITTKRLTMKKVEPKTYPGANLLSKIKRCILRKKESEAMKEELQPMEDNKIQSNEKVLHRKSKPCWVMHTKPLLSSNTLDLDDNEKIGIGPTLDSQSDDSLYQNLGYKSPDSLLSEFDRPLSTKKNVQQQDFDILEDIIVDKNKRKVACKVKDLTVKLEESDAALKHCKETCDKLQEDNCTLLRNITSLWKTACTQLSRQRSKIENLTKQRDSLLLGREMKQMSQEEMNELIDKIARYHKEEFQEFMKVISAQRRSCGRGKARKIFSKKIGSTLSVVGCRINVNERVDSAHLGSLMGSKARLVSGTAQSSILNIGQNSSVGNSSQKNISSEKVSKKRQIYITDVQKNNKNDTCTKTRNFSLSHSSNNILLATGSVDDTIVSSKQKESMHIERGKSTSVFAQNIYDLLSTASANSTPSLGNKKDEVDEGIPLPAKVSKKTDIINGTSRKSSNEELKDSYTSEISKDPFKKRFSNFVPKVNDRKELTSDVIYSLKIPKTKNTDDLLKAKTALQTKNSSKLKKTENSFKHYLRSQRKEQNNSELENDPLRKLESRTPVSTTGKENVCLTKCERSGKDSKKEDSKVRHSRTQEERYQLRNVKATKDDVKNYKCSSGLKSGRGSSQHHEKIKKLKTHEKISYPKRELTNSDRHHQPKHDGGYRRESSRSRGGNRRNERCPSTRYSHKNGKESSVTCFSEKEMDRRSSTRYSTENKSDRRSSTRCSARFSTEKKSDRRSSTRFCTENKSDRHSSTRCSAKHKRDRLSSIKYSDEKWDNLKSMKDALQTIIKTSSEEKEEGEISTDDEGDLIHFHNKNSAEEQKHCKGHTEISFPSDLVTKLVYSHDAVSEEVTSSQSILNRHEFSNMFVSHLKSTPADIRDQSERNDFEIMQGKFTANKVYKECSMDKNNCKISYVNSKAMKLLEKMPEEASIDKIAEEVTENQIVSEEGTENQIVSEEGTENQMISEEGTETQIVSEEGTENQIVSEKGTGNQMISEEGTENQIVSEEGTENQIVSEEGTENQMISEEGTENQIVSEEGTENQIVSEKGTGNQMVSEEGTENQMVSEEGTENHIVSNVSEVVSDDIDHIGRKVRGEDTINKIMREVSEALHEEDTIYKIVRKPSMESVGIHSDDSEFTLHQFLAHEKENSEPQQFLSFSPPPFVRPPQLPRDENAKRLKFFLSAEPTHLQSDQIQDTPSKLLITTSCSPIPLSTPLNPPNDMTEATTPSPVNMSLKSSTPICSFYLDGKPKHSMASLPYILQQVASERASSRECPSSCHAIPEVLSDLEGPSCHAIPEVLSDLEGPSCHAIPEVISDLEGPSCHAIPEVISDLERASCHAIPEVLSDLEGPSCHAIPEVISNLEWHHRSLEMGNLTKTFRFRKKVPFITLSREVSRSSQDSTAVEQGSMSDGCISFFTKKLDDMEESILVNGEKIDQNDKILDFSSLNLSSKSVGSCEEKSCSCNSSSSSSDSSSSSSSGSGTSSSSCSTCTVSSVGQKSDSTNSDQISQNNSFKNCLVTSVPPEEKLDLSKASPKSSCVTPEKNCLHPSSNVQSPVTRSRSLQALTLQKDPSSFLCRSKTEHFQSPFDSSSKISFGNKMVKLTEKTNERQASNSANTRLTRSSPAKSRLHQQLEEKAISPSGILRNRSQDCVKYAWQSPLNISEESPKDNPAEVGWNMRLRSPCKSLNIKPQAKARKQRVRQDHPVVDSVQEGESSALATESYSPRVLVSGSSTNEESVRGDHREDSLGSAKVWFESESLSKRTPNKSKLSEAVKELSGTFPPQMEEFVHAIYQPLSCFGTSDPKASNKARLTTDLLDSCSSSTEMETLKKSSHEYAKTNRMKRQMFKIVTPTAIVISRGFNKAKDLCKSQSSNVISICHEEVKDSEDRGSKRKVREEEEETCDRIIREIESLTESAQKEEAGEWSAQMGAGNARTAVSAVPQQILIKHKVKRRKVTLNIT